jgi:capsular exopolysaccharide synthesis family protein
METSEVKEVSLSHLLKIYRRRKYVIYGVMVAVCIATAFYCAICTRRYEATAELQVDKEGSNAMGLDEMMSSATEGGTSSLSSNIEIETQANILQSDTLALKTMEALHMQDTADFRPHFNPLGWVLGKFSPHGPSEAPGTRFEDSPSQQQSALSVFKRNLKVEGVPGTRLIDIKYRNPDPKLATAVVNTLTRALSDFTFQTRYQATNEASQWLSGQLGDLRKESERLQAQVVNLQREAGVFSLGSPSAGGQGGSGGEVAYSEILDRLQKATTAETDAEENVILKGAVARAAEAGDADMLSGLAGNSSVVGAQLSTSLSLIQSIRAQEATEEAALREAETTYGPGYPKVAELRGNLASLKHSIDQEIGRIKARAQSDYEIATRVEAGTRKIYEVVKQQANTLNNKAIEYEIVRQEADQSRTLYESLFSRLQEAGVLAGLRSSDVTVVDPGRTPAHPATPNVPAYMGIALVGGWFLGCFVAMFTENLDNKISNVQELEDIYKESVVGVLPKIQPGQANEILAVAQPDSVYVEALRTVRTALLLSHSDAPPKVLLVTSSMAGEGKSLCSVNLAVILSQSGRRTLLVDTDLRRGTLRTRLGIPKGPGLSDLLAGQLTEPNLHQIQGIDNFDILTGGTPPPNPTDLLQSEAMKHWLTKFRAQYDFVVLDSAPVLPVTDSVGLNTLTDATLLLARSRLTERPQLQRSFNMLRMGGRHYVAIILNALSISDSSYYGYYGYRKDGYSYAKDGKE